MMGVNPCPLYLISLRVHIQAKRRCQPSSIISLQSNQSSSKQCNECGRMKRNTKQHRMSKSNVQKKYFKRNHNFCNPHYPTNTERGIFSTTGTNRNYICHETEITEITEITRLLIKTQNLGDLLKFPFSKYIRQVVI